MPLQYHQKIDSFFNIVIIDKDKDTYLFLRQKINFILQPRIHQKHSMKSITTDSYEVHFNQKALNRLNTYLDSASYSSMFIIVDENTYEHCLPNFMAEIIGDHHFEVLEIESGEENKNIQTCLNLWQALSDLDADRKSLIINLGGGVVTDLGGFVASTFKRGVDFINVPTTLLSMVDASVGGKTGVDLGPLKNQIGVINQPKMVLIQTGFLKTLEQRQLNSGFAEMLKHGLIQDANYWNELINTVDFSNMDAKIGHSVEIKNKVVLEDPTEKGHRKILNFGHTLGHAIESYFLVHNERETLYHGEAIAIGMILEAYLSKEILGLPADQLSDITVTFLDRYGKVDFDENDVDHILNLLRFDKKNSHGNINFALIKSIGQPVLDVKIPEHLYALAFAYYKDA
jgi:3-dehydroquinate synthase